jgi:hypothetical protein
MAEIVLTQSEADLLITLKKHRVDDKEVDYPDLGGSVVIPLMSVDKREKFWLDIRRGRIDLRKGTYQNRAREVVVLVRLDFGGAPHRNPDGEEIPAPHLHLYREGYGDKWAYPVPLNKFMDLADLRATLDNFMDYCNITRKPMITRTLFS